MAPTNLSNCVGITSTFPSLGDASTLVGMTVLEEVILTIILSDADERTSTLVQSFVEVIGGIS